ncbi:hypothetical protein Sango_2101700 [Sesamum angolense]|uniref:Uncharacterized protein n=1 Tax=Sesamum angolense TaxID=2727404 RepID=A0AAE1WBM6_9LAMI|nr:hypothetical protein Sango_2101700 [Sesamum angolense]
MVFDATGPSYFASSHEGVPDDGTRSCPVDIGPSSYCYGGSGPYDYDESGLADHFLQYSVCCRPTFVGRCTQSQLGDVAKLVDIKADGHIFERIYERISQCANRILPSDHTLLGDYYSTKKLVHDLGLPIEMIHECKNSFMLYWKDDVDLEYCKFCGDARYKLSRGRDPHQKKSLYAVLRYLPLTPHLQRLYSSRVTAEHMTWHSTIRQRRGRCVIHPC